MCKHILNAQVAIQSPCCQKWFDCSECHDIHMDHQMGYSSNILFACHACNLSFRKDCTIYGNKDEVCPHCINSYVRPAITPESCMFVEGNVELDKMLAIGIDGNHAILSNSLIGVAKIIE